MELGLPKYVRYDFLITLLGIGLVVFAYYFRFIHQQLQLQEDHYAFLIVIGVGIFFYGISQMYYNYKIESDIFILESFVKRKEAINRMKRLKIIDQEKSDSLNFFIKDELNDFIDKKKKDEPKPLP